MEIGEKPPLHFHLHSVQAQRRFGRHVGRKGVPVLEWQPKDCLSRTGVSKSETLLARLSQRALGVLSVGAFVLERNF